MERYLPPLTEKARRWLRFLGVVAGGVGLVFLAQRFSAVLTPIAAALAIAYILNPVVTFLEQKRSIPRPISVSVGLATVVLFAAALTFLGVLQLIELAADARAYFDDVAGWASRTFAVVSPASAPSNLRDLASEHGATVASYVLGTVSSVLGNLGYWTTFTVLVPLYAFFFLVAFNDIVRAIRDHLPVESRPTIVHVVTTIDRAIADFFRGRLIVCFIVGTLNGFGWMIVGVKHSLLLGALAGILNLVPFMSMLSLPPALLFSWLAARDAGDPWIYPVMAALGVFVVVQAIESFALTPLIESRTNGLHPITTVVALLVGAEVAGLLGMLLSIPVASTLKSLGAKYVLPEIRRLAADPPTSGNPEPPATPTEAPPTVDSAAPDKEETAGSSPPKKAPKKQQK